MKYGIDCPCRYMEEDSSSSMSSSAKMTNVWKVKTQAMQLKAMRKRIKSGDVEVIHGDTGDEEPSHNMAQYFNNLLALLIAYSVPGVQTVGEPQHAASEWVVQFPNAQMNLGEVIQTIMIQRQALWAIPQAAQVHQQSHQQSALQPPRQHKAPRMRPGKDKGGSKEGGKGGGRISRAAMKMENKFGDETPVCMAFNHGKYQDNPCNKGMHVCAGAVVQCKSPHPAIKCNNAEAMKR